MKTDWPEIFWLGLFCMTGIVGIFALLPTSTQLDITRWIEVLGGWAGATVAIPSLFLLRRQTVAMAAQSKLAANSTISLNIEKLLEEYRASQAITKEIHKVASDSLAASAFLFGGSINDVHEFCLQRASRIAIVCETASDQVMEFVRHSPSTAISLQRHRVIFSGDQFTSSVQAKMDEITKAWAAYREGTNQEENLALARHRMMDMSIQAPSAPMLQACMAWREAITLEVSRLQDTINESLELH